MLGADTNSCMSVNVISGMLACHHGLCYNGAGCRSLEVAGDSVETSHGGHLKLLYDPQTAVRLLGTVSGARLCAIQTSQTSIVALYGVIDS